VEPIEQQLDTWLEQILVIDPMRFENAYQGMRPNPAMPVLRLLVLLHSTQDPFGRGKFLELLGEPGDRSIIPVISAEQDHPDQHVREGARYALSALDQEIIWQRW